LTKATADPPSKSAEQLEAARALCRAGKFAEGIEIFRRVIATDPQNAAAHNFLGMALDRTGKPGEALPCFERAIAADPEFSDALANKADALSALGRFREAIKSYDQALGIDAQNFIAWLNRAAALFATHDYERALASNDRAIAIEPDNPLAILNRARTLGAMGRTGEEAESLRKLVAAQPNMLEARLMLGSALLRLKDFNEALAQFDAVLASNPESLAASIGGGHALVGLNRWEEALKSYDAALRKRDDIPELHAGRSYALTQAARFEEATEAIDRAIALDAESPKYHAHRAELQSRLGRHDEVAKSKESIAALSASDPRFQFNRGMDALKEDNFGKAREHFQKVLQLDPAYTDAMLALSEIAIRSNEHPLAIALALRALQTKETPQTRSYFSDRILGLGLVGQNEDFRAALVKAVNGMWLPPKHLFPYVAAVIREGPAKAVFDDANERWPKPFPADKLMALSLEDIFKDQLFVCTLSNILFASIEFEKFLTLLRRRLLEIALDPAALVEMREEAVNFVSALAQQCFMNEYIFRLEPDEQTRLNSLIADVRSSNKDSSQDLFKVAVLGAYESLAKHFKPGDFDGLSMTSEFERMIRFQVKEIETLERIRSEIPQLTPIEDTVSVAVRGQYEESPYPRWVRFPNVPLFESVEKELEDIFPYGPPIDPRGREGKTEVLVAGCGTGHQLSFTPRFRNANVLAIDLSLSSLSYAKMRMEARSTQLISFGQADILKLASLGRTFDVIYSTGVLHHMKDPEAGWSVLTSLLKPSGFMQIALYSETARRHVVKAREEIARRGLAPTVENIRRFRQEIGFEKDFSLGPVTAFGDFFTTSELRDLLFHVQEHRFTIPRIAKFLTENNLQFLGFDVPVDIQNKFLKQQSGKSPIDLDAWQEFEEQNPDTFAAMYNFWLQKKKAH
jgi:tetratricopeptide (TPR) repeat protein/SAM-dependent methyltransferase